MKWTLNLVISLTAKVFLELLKYQCTHYGCWTTRHVVRHTTRQAFYRVVQQLQYILRKCWLSIPIDLTKNCRQILYHTFLGFCAHKCCHECMVNPINFVRQRVEYILSQFPQSAHPIKVPSDTQMGTRSTCTINILKNLSLFLIWRPRQDGHPYCYISFAVLVFPDFSDIA